MSDAEHAVMSDGDYIAGLNRDLMRERARAEDAELNVERLRRLVLAAPSYLGARAALHNEWLRQAEEVVGAAILWVPNLTPGFECSVCHDERVILVPDPAEAPTYESGPYAAERPCPACTPPTR